MHFITLMSKSLLLHGWSCGLSLLPPRTIKQKKSYFGGNIRKPSLWRKTPVKTQSSFNTKQFALGVLSSYCSNIYFSTGQTMLKMQRWKSVFKDHRMHYLVQKVQFAYK